MQRPTRHPQVLACLVLVSFICTREFYMYSCQPCVRVSPYSPSALREYLCLASALSTHIILVMASMQQPLKLFSNQNFSVEESVLTLYILNSVVCT